MAEGYTLPELNCGCWVDLGSGNKSNIGTNCNNFASGQVAG